VRGLVGAGGTTEGNSLFSSGGCDEDDAVDDDDDGGTIAGAVEEEAEAFDSLAATASVDEPIASRMAFVRRWPARK